MTTTKICFGVFSLIQIKTTQFILLLYLFISATATSEATSNIATASKKIAPTNSNENNLSSEAASPPTPPPPPTTKTNTNTHLSNIYAWGHNTKYATIIFNENIIVKGSSLLDIKYPAHDDLYNDYTIIGIYTFAIDRLHLNVKEFLANDISVFIVEGGVGSKFAKIRFKSQALDDVEFSLKIFGIYV